MQLAQQTAVIVGLGVALALAVLAWRRRVRRLKRENPQAQYRRDIQALQRPSRIPATGLCTEDVWSAGAASDSPYSRSKKAATWVALGSVGGCGGCGGCGCGG